ncbi:MAG TPA: hypothetical protein PLN69_07310 [bacterium]|nr:hypothetical protein [bacterium]
MAGYRPNCDISRASGEKAVITAAINPTLRPSILLPAPNAKKMLSAPKIANGSRSQNSENRGANESHACMNATCNGGVLSPNAAFMPSEKLRVAIQCVYASS